MCLARLLKGLFVALVATDVDLSPFLSVHDKRVLHDLALHAPTTSVRVTCTRPRADHSHFPPSSVLLISILQGTRYLICPHACLTPREAPSA